MTRPTVQYIDSGRSFELDAIKRDLCILRAAFEILVAVRSYRQRFYVGSKSRVINCVSQILNPVCCAEAVEVLVSCLGSRTEDRDLASAGDVSN